MNEIDWSQAPEGATHYLAENKKHGWFACWYKYGSNEWLCMSDSNRHGWIADNDDVALFEPMLIKRQAPSWSGEGLPPVGVVCEYRVCDGPWYKCEIRYTIKHPDGGVIAYCPHLDHEQTLYAPYCQFRPIRTPEQIAAELADQAIKEIAGIICRDGAFDIDDPEVTESAVALYDAGYRKP